MGTILPQLSCRFLAVWVSSCRLSCIPGKTTSQRPAQHYSCCNSIVAPELPVHVPSLILSHRIKREQEAVKAFKPKHLLTAADSELHVKQGQFRARHHPAGLPLSSAQLHVWPNSCILLVMCYHQFHSEDTTDALITTNIFVSNAQALPRVTKHFPPPHHHFHVDQQVLEVPNSGLPLKCTVCWGSLELSKRKSAKTQHKHE